MANKKAVKKSRRRLKRTARRSLAAVLMITAVVVAAIPVPENAAAPGDGGSNVVEDGHTVYSYNELKTQKSDGDQSAITDLANYFNDKGANRDWLNKYEDKYDPDSDNYDPTATPPDTYPALSKSLRIFDNGREMELTWEYKYYEEESSERVVLCKYNERYKRGDVTLKSDPIIEYFTVPSDAFADYFDLKKADDTNPKDDGLYIVIESSDTLSVKMDIDPYTEPVAYTYTNFINMPSYEASDAKKFFDAYAPGIFEQQTKIYKEYQTNKEAYEKENGPGTYTEPEPQQLGKTITEDDTEKIVPYTMTELLGNSAENRMKFFCEHCKTLNDYGKGFTLKAVRDTTSKTTDNTAKYTYVAYGGDNATVVKPGVQNIEGYMVTRVGPHVSAIGKHAFKNVGNVVNITLPDLIKYIGDEAFLKCNSVVELNIPDVTLIGNRAFQSCNALTTVTMGNGVYQVGVEGFADCRQLGNVTFSPNTAVIGAGAFANCISLTTLNFNNIIQPCEIEAAAFYNCSALNKVDMVSSAVTKIGDSAFACTSGDSMTEFVFPEAIVDEEGALGDRLFCNRAALKKVVFPKNYGRNKVITIPNSMFHGCSQLEVVEFPTLKGTDARACANLKYSTGDADKISSELFADVVNRGFYVSGPATKSNDDYAEPRRATWLAFTKAYNDTGFVPYLYYENGVEYYEICSDNYLECIKKNADGTGTLFSCKLRPGATTTGGTLIIPDKVGDTDVVAIDTNCFTKDDQLTKSVKTLVINDKIKTIAPSTFENKDGRWNRLSEVTIGSAVESIGSRAFYDCSSLKDITFKSPSGGDYAKPTFPDDALKTNGDKLTIHGDIKTGYRPFDYAVNPDTYVKNPDEGIRVCYQSRWDSPESKHISVMYGKSSHTSGEGKSAYITLLDYPKYSELEDINSSTGAELRQHSLDREREFYEKYAIEDYDNKRIAFAQAWDTATDSSSVYGETDAAGDSLYGPWINSDFCTNWQSWKDKTEDLGKGDDEHLFDWLFEPLTVEAAPVENPKPYFESNHFNFMTNYKDCQGNEDLIPRFQSNGNIIDYLGWNDFEKQIISSVENIVIPAGVDSIDVKDYYENNKSNFSRYFLDKYKEYISGEDTSDKITVPGLFSGWIKDYDSGSDKDNFETEERGNDRIRSVVMTSVKYLPDYAFDNCERLETVSLGDAMEEVGALPFRDCGRLVNLNGNDKYPAENGILYERQPGENEAYGIVECLLARGKSSPINERTVTALTDSRLPLVSGIDKRAFAECNDISLVDLSAASALKLIPEGCFKDTKNLVNVILPASVNDIQDDAFAGICAESTQTPRSKIEIPGMEVSITDGAFGADDEYQPGLKHAKDRITIKTSKDTAAYRYAEYYKKEGMEVEAYPDSENVYSVVFMDYDGTQIGNTQYITNDFAVEPDTTELQKTDHRPGYEFTGWLATNDQSLREKITQNCIFLAQYRSDGTMFDGKYTVEFFDGIDGSPMRGYGASADGKYYVEADQKSFADMGFEPPTHKTQPGYEAMGYRDYKGEWTINTVIDRNMSVILLYRATSSSNASTSSGSTSNGSTNNGNNGGNSGNNNGNTSSNSSSTSSSSTSSSSTSSSSTSSSSTSSSSTSTTSTTSGAGQYTVFVDGGSGSGSYAPGTTVIISCYAPAEGMRFDKWTTDSNGVSMASVSMPVTTFTMPSNNVTIKANYVEAATATAATVNTTGTNDTTTGGNGNTRVDIEKPGISNRDLATANVSGSTDNFVVKISETDEATRAVAAALTNKYGTLDNILYYAMDISLYDSTGTTKITDTTGLSVDITIPIPDSLVAYGGNNMAGAVINGDQLESLNENFTTINGVPCIRFRATHFSPYTVYVDTGNLVEGMLDVTPKTGDPIHPKWFLSLGLACLSIILFMKRDKKVTVKA